MKQLAVLSFFRNSARSGQAARFFKQVSALQRHARIYANEPWMIRVIAVHGDSTDGTEGELIRLGGEHMLSTQLIRADHGGPVYGSTEEPARMKALSMIANRGLDAVRFDDDYVWYVESDLVWDADTVWGLLFELRVREFVSHISADAIQQQPGLIAPLVFAGEAFYDIWGFRRSGHRFGPFHPYHGELQFDDLTTGMDSVGSCFVMYGDVARTCRIHDDAALVGFCADVRAKGWDIAVDARKKVVHP